MKNIVVCCDGTRAEYGESNDNTNVVRLFERLGSDGEGQVSYYDPGVGTYSPLRGPIGRGLDKLAMAVSGSGVDTNVQEAYRYLMDNYQQGDRLYLFGYSRGAHTVRALAGMLHKCGLLTKGSHNLIPYAAKAYRGKDDEIARSFKGSFSRECRPHLIGVWDTVAATGWLCWRKYFSNHRLNSDVTYGYQALSVDETRAHFQVARWDESEIPEGQMIEQVWFPGCHADVGGQKADRPVSDVSLEWMLRSAKSKGLVLRDDWREELQLGSLGEIKPSRRHVWLLLPMRRRHIPEGAKIHKSVFQRMEALGSRYRPPNLPDSYVEAE